MSKAERWAANGVLALVVVFSLVTVAGWMFHRIACGCGESKVRITEEQVDQLAHGTYKGDPEWNADVWGTPFEWHSGLSADGALVVRVTSAGEDGKLGTPDDIWSESAP